MSYILGVEGYREDNICAFFDHAFKLGTDGKL